MMWVVLIFATGAIAAHRDPRVNHIPLADVDELRHLGGKQSRGFNGDATSSLSIIEEIHSTLSTQIQLTLTSSVGHVPTVAVYSGSSSLSSHIDATESFEVTRVSSEPPQSAESVVSAQFTESASAEPLEPTTTSEGISASRVTIDTSTQAFTNDTRYITFANFSSGIDTEHTTTISPSSSIVVGTIAESPTTVVASLMSHTGVPISANIIVDEMPIDDPIISDKPLYQDPVEAENEYFTDGATEPQEDFEDTEEPVNLSSVFATHNSTHAAHHNGTRAHHNGTRAHHNGTHHHGTHNSTHAHRNVSLNAASDLLVANGTANSLLTAVNTTRMAIFNGTHLVPVNATLPAAIESTTIDTPVFNSSVIDTVHFNSTKSALKEPLFLNSTRLASFNGTHLVPANITRLAPLKNSTHDSAHDSINTTEEFSSSSSSFESDEPSFEFEFESAFEVMEPTENFESMEFVPELLEEQQDQHQSMGTLEAASAPIDVPISGRTTSPEFVARQH